MASHGTTVRATAVGVLFLLTMCALQADDLVRPRLFDAEDSLALAVSPDGKYVASTGNKTLAVWDTASNRRLWKVPLPSVAFTLAFSPDGGTLAWAGGAQAGEIPIHLCDALTGKELCRLVGHRDTVTSLAFTGDGQKLISGSRDGTLRFFSMSKQKETLKIDVRLTETAEGKEPDLEPIESLSLSPDGKVLASGGWLKVHLWDPEKGTKLGVLQADGGAVTSLAFSPDGTKLAGGGNVRVWDVGTRKELLRLPAAGWTRVAFSPDGKSLAIGDSDSVVRIWDLTSGKARATLRGHNGFPVSSVVFLPKGLRLFSGSANGVVVWDFGT